MKTKILILSITFIVSFASFGQIRTGLTTSNMSGSNGNIENPARIVNNPLSWDFNLISFGVFLDNNFLTIPNNSLITVGSKNLTPISDDIPRTNLNSNAYLVINDNKKFTRIGLDLTARGPSFMFSTTNAGIGFFNNTRANITIKNIPDQLVPFFFGGIDGASLTGLALGGIDLRNFSINALAWHEFGVSYGKYIVDDQFYKIKGGINGKFLLGAAKYGLNFDQITAQPDFSLSAIQNFENIQLDINYAFLNPAKVTGKWPNYISGLGMGFDAGILVEEYKVYKKRFKTYKQKYEWQLGIGINDIGAISFGPKNLVTNTIKGQGLTEALALDTVNGEYMDEVAKFIDKASQPQFSGLDDGEGSFSILPASMQIHVDRTIWQNFYLFGKYKMGIPGLNDHLRTPANLVIAPRYESNAFDFAIPLTFHDWRHFRYGFNFRWSFLTLGSDNLSNIFRKNATITGADIYFGLRFYRIRRDTKPNTFIHKWLRSRKKHKKQKRFNVVSPRF